jgi:hypothetical protein
LLLKYQLPKFYVAEDCPSKITTTKIKPIEVTPKMIRRKCITKLKNNWLIVQQI